MPGKNYQDIIKQLHQLLQSCPDPNKKDPTEEGWSIKQIVGHLIDSAGNNHQRLSRYRAGGHLDFPGYDQLQFVDRAHYDSFDFQTLVALWFNYNQLFLHMVNHLPPEDLQSTLAIGDRPAITLEALAEDYFAHMELHEAQIKQIIDTPEA